MLDNILEQTNLYIETFLKKERKKYGQFFTSGETAKFMAKQFHIPKGKKIISILDAGIGSGILSCALIEQIQLSAAVEKVHLTCYENDINILKLLEGNLRYIKNNCAIEFDYKIIKDNYITSQYMDFNEMIVGNTNPKKYDFVIGNPPYMKIPKDAAEAQAMPEICYGSPNLYFLFTAMGLFNLKSEGELVYIIPRSWTSGAYFKRFRDYLLTAGKLEHIHLFISRNKVFDKENVLQETIIIKVRKTEITPVKVKLTSSRSNNDFEDITTLYMPYDIVVSGKERYVYLVTNEKEANVLKLLNSWKNTLPDIGLKMKTGLTVDFRNRDVLRNEENENTIPLFYSQHIKEGRVKFPIQKEYEFVETTQSGLKQRNKNYLFVKRFTTKEERRRLQCGIYLAQDFPQYAEISTQNKINFIDGLVNDISKSLVYGLYVLFNSTAYDLYYRILNGSTQVNSTEVNSMPIPTIGIIQQMGEELINSTDLSEEKCNKILEGYYGKA